MDRKEEIKRQLMITFQAELEDHLGTLSKGLLALEEGCTLTERDALLANLFRAAHSLKGAARSVSLRDIETIGHRLEDVLGAIRRGELSPAPALFDVLLAALDAIQEAMAAYRRGETLPLERRNRLLASLDAASREGAPAGQQGDVAAAPKPLPPIAPVELAPAPVVDGRVSALDKPPPSQVPRPEPQQETPGQESPPSQPRPVSVLPSPILESIRVATDKLDALMDGVGELLVARMRTEQGLIELEKLEQHVSHWQKSWRRARAHHGRLQQAHLSDLASPGTDPSLPDPLFPASHRQEGPAADVEPLLAFLTLNEEHLKTIHAETSALLRRLAGDCGHLGLLTDDLQDRVRRVRMLPMATLFDLFPRMVRDLARERDKAVTLEIEGADTEVDRQVLEAMTDPMIHLLRNAVDHGIEPPEQRAAAGKPQRGTIHLRAAQKGNTVVLEVSDDGAGISLPAVRQAAVKMGVLSAAEAASLSEQDTLALIFRSGLSTKTTVTEISGRGVGLDVVREALGRLHGLVDVSSVPGRGTTFTLTLPFTLATSYVLLVQVASQTVAIPTTTVQRVLRVNPASVGCMDGKPAIRLNDRPIPLISLAQVLEMRQADSARPNDQAIPVVVVGAAEKRIAFRVETLLETHEVVVKRLGYPLKRVRNVAGVTTLGTGQVVMILNAADLIQSAQVGGRAAAATPLPSEIKPARRRRVLLVDDSITTRTLEKNILENSGYQVLAAADGQEAWALVQSEAVDVIVSDVAMPRMDGFAFAEKVKNDKRFQELPLILVTSLETQQDRLRGLQAGADAYITKGSFDQQELLETIERLIG